MKFLLSSLLAFQALGFTQNLDFKPVPTEVTEEMTFVPGQYVVVFQKHIAAQDRQKHMEKYNHTNAKHQWSINKGEIQAYGIETFDDSLITNLKSETFIRAVEPNIIVRTTQDCQSVRSGSWGLQRSSLAGRLPTSPAIEDIPYEFSNCGRGIEIHVLDTGIQLGHEDFGGRATWGGDWTLEGDFDGHGHGTHVASTAGGSAFGLARCSPLVALKVMTSGGFGTLFSILGGLEFSSNAATAGKKVVGNMSLGAVANFLLNEIVDATVRAGVLMAVAAGNANEDACNTSPAGANLVFTTGATNREDQRSFFSNWGRCVRIMSPGSNITAAWIGANNNYRTVSGTSMACPHLAGVCAKFWAMNPLLTPAQIQATIIRQGTAGIIEDVRGSANLLLNMNCNSRP